MHTFRFPLKNVPLLEKWEKAVNNANDSSEWKAKHFFHICSNHFTIQDYVIPPSDNRTCRLKHNAVPISFPLVSSNTPPSGGFYNELESGGIYNEFASGGFYNEFVSGGIYNELESMTS